MWPPLQDEDSKSTAALEVLEEIDDDLDEAGIIFVKLDDEVATHTSFKLSEDPLQKEAAEYGIDQFPSLVVFENGIPNLYDGGFTDSQVLYRHRYHPHCLLISGGVVMDHLGVQWRPHHRDSHGQHAGPGYLLL